MSAGYEATPLNNLNQIPDAEDRERIRARLSQEGWLVLPDGRILGDYSEVFTAEVVLAYDCEGFGCDWFIDLYVPCSGSCGGKEDDLDECEHDFDLKRHRVGHQYVRHADLLSMFADAYGNGLRDVNERGIAWMFPEDFKPVGD